MNRRGKGNRFFMRYIDEIVAIIEKLWTSLRSAIGSHSGDNPSATPREKLEDVLAAQAESLSQGDRSMARYLNRLPAEHETLGRLLLLATRVNETLHPVTPAVGFRERLHNDLMRQAHARCGTRQTSVWEAKRKEIIIGATVGSVLSAAGVLAYVLVYHHPWNNRPNAGTG
jgi:hypothetical protein